MLTFRRALVAAAFFLTIFYLTTRTSTPSPTAPSPAPAAVPINDKGKVDSANHASTTGATPGSRAGTGGANRHGSPTGQKPLQDMSKMSLYQKLAYQYPYDVETKFPAYIWQTWKYTPANGEFTFRDQEATWT
jgi:alpha 1,6-mannosyltransferase